MPIANKYPLTTSSKSYKPFVAPWAYDYWEKQQLIHWVPHEVPLGDDVKDWSQKLTPEERNLVTQIFRFFTQSDVEVGANYMETLIPIFKPVEVRMMLSAFSAMETVHIASYALLLETIGMPDTEFSAFMQYEEMMAKHDFLNQFGVDNEEDLLTNMAVFAGFTEGLQLFASFAMLLNFPRRNLLKGMGQIVSWSVRDESLHCEGMTRLFHAFAEETGYLTQRVTDRIYDACIQSVRLEDKFIDLAFEAGQVEGTTPTDIKQYIRFVADHRLRQLGLKGLYNVGEHPLPWLSEILNGVEHTNFFENRATEYSKGATTGAWADVSF